jgi:hypothetical protein
LCESGDGGLLIVTCFILGRRDVPNRFEQPSMVEPIYPVERGEFDRLERSPRSLPANHFRLEEANHRLGEGVEAPICQESHLVPDQAAGVRVARNR